MAERTVSVDRLRQLIGRGGVSDRTLAAVVARLVDDDAERVRKRLRAGLHDLGRQVWLVRYLPSKPSQSRSASAADVNPTPPTSICYANPQAVVRLMCDRCPAFADALQACLQESGRGAAEDSIDSGPLITL